MKWAWTLTALFTCLCLARADLIFELKDGSQVKSIAQEAPIIVKTKFGDLSVPLSQIEFIQFGYRLASEEETRIKILIGNLGGTPKEREESFAQLKKLGGVAYPFLLSLLLDEQDLERKTRLRQLVDHIKDNSNETLQTEFDDKITTKAFTIKGVITNASLEVNNSTLGRSNVPLFQLKTLAMSTRRSFSITQADEWIDTGIICHSSVNIYARGNFDLYPRELGRYVTTPEGKSLYGNKDGFPVGTLVGKFGEGPPFKIGDFVLISPQSGTLSLKVIPSIWPNAGETGSYEVTIK